jgi:hypothetical protein
MGKLKQVLPFRYGHDTEFFLWDTKKEKVVPSYKFFGEKKDEPEYLPGIPYPNEPKLTKTYAYPLLRSKYSRNNMKVNSGGEFRYYRDGLAVEFNSSPVTCRAWIWQDLKLAMATAESVKDLPAHVRFTARPWVAISPQLIRHFPDDLKVLGCSPTLDAYTEQTKAVLVNPLKTYFRTSGAHMHCSFDDMLPEEHWGPIIKLCDLCIGVPHTYIFADELEFKRRKLYGTAGEFRPQKYPNGQNGLEYRALSSRLYNHPGIFGLFSGIFKYVITENYAQMWEHWDSAWEADIQEAINLGTPALFPKLLEIGTNLTKKFTSIYRIQVAKNNPPLEFWNTLRKLHVEGAFPDAGVINHMAFPEAHKGWSEYATTWKL